MASDLWQRMEDLFSQATALPEEERLAFLKRECGEDTETFEAVASLLESDRGTVAFMAGPLADPDPEEEATKPVDGERRIGPYRLLEEIGQGGMSTVYRAEQEGPIRRKVAIKLIRRGMESAETRRRLRAERQILAGLEHPNIARLYDGGMTEEGLPFFVMELVEGDPIDRYCDLHQLSVGGRLKLFRKICTAVRYAHQNLVVHRDIKPSNILVTAEGEPKLLDFGIAKLLDPAAGSDAEPTVAWMRLMTPHYASPEQILGQKVTTSSDVYSLGVLLYKLLVGRLPHRGQSHTLSELERLVTRRDTAPPSSRLVPEPEEGHTAEWAAEEVRKISAARGIRPEQLQRLLAGDLDTIVLKAMHRDPARRFSSVEQLSDDVRRYLEGFPVQARPDTLGYRARKFLRRNWLPVATAALFLLLLTGSTLALALQSARIRLERDQLREVVSFVVDVFNVAGEGEQLSVKQAVDRSAALLEHKLLGQPTVQATLRNTLGRIYLNLGAAPRAQEQLEQAVRLRRSQGGNSSPEVAESLSSLGVALTHNGEFDDGEARAREALDIYRDRLGPRHPQVVAPMNNLVSVLCFRGDNDDTVHELAAETLELARELLPEDRLELGHALTHRALLLGRRGQHGSAAQLYRQALDLYRRTLGEEHPEIASVLNNLAYTMNRQGDAAGAEDLYRQTLALQRRLFGDDSSSVAQTLHNVGTLLVGRQAYEEAESVYREAVAIVDDVHGPGHYSNVVTAGGLAQTLMGKGEAGEAERLLEERFPLWRDNLEGSWFLAYAEGLLGESLKAQGRFREAEPLLESGYRGLREIRGDAFPRTRRAREALVDLYERWGKEDLARRLREAADAAQPVGGAS